MLLFKGFDIMPIIQISAKDAGNGVLELTINHPDPNLLCNRLFIVSTGTHFQVMYAELHEILNLILLPATARPWSINQPHYLHIPTFTRI